MICPARCRMSSNDLSGALALTVAAPAALTAAACTACSACSLGTSCPEAMPPEIASGVCAGPGAPEAFWMLRRRASPSGGTKMFDGRACDIPGSSWRSSRSGRSKTCNGVNALSRHPGTMDCCARCSSCLPVVGMSSTSTSGPCCLPANVCLRISDFRASSCRCLSNSFESELASSWNLLMSASFCSLVVRSFQSNNPRYCGESGSDDSVELSELHGDNADVTNAGLRPFCGALTEIGANVTSRMPDLFWAIFEDLILASASSTSDGVISISFGSDGWPSSAGGTYLRGCVPPSSEGVVVASVALAGGPTS